MVKMRRLAHTRICKPNGMLRLEETHRSEGGGGVEGGVGGGKGGFTLFFWVSRKIC